MELCLVNASPKIEVSSVGSIRRFVTRRKLRKGEAVLHDDPILDGPALCTVQRTFCIGCYKTVDCSVMCEDCKWPICDEDCDRLHYHRALECIIFTEARREFYDHKGHKKKKKQSNIYLQYCCVLPLRILILVQQEPTLWNMLSDTNLDINITQAASYRKQYGNSVRDNYVVSYIRKSCRLTRFTEERIYQVLSIIDMKGITFSANEQFVTCLYRSYPCITHCCVPNVEYFISRENDYRLYVRAAVNIFSDEEICMCKVDVLSPTLLRRQALLHSKYIVCKCKRCVDKFELGTHLSTLKCSMCKRGDVISMDTLNFESDWICINCAATMYYKRWHLLQNKIIDDMAIMDSVNSIDEFESFFNVFENKYEECIHPTHAYMIYLKYKLLTLMFRDPLLVNIESVKNEKIVRYAEEIKRTFEIILPGDTFKRNDAYFIFAEIKIALANASNMTGEITQRDYDIEFTKSKRQLSTINTIIYEPFNEIELKSVHILDVSNNLCESTDAANTLPNETVITNGHAVPDEYTGGISELTESLEDTSHVLDNVCDKESLVDPYIDSNNNADPLNGNIFHSESDDHEKVIFNQPTLNNNNLDDDYEVIPLNGDDAINNNSNDSYGDDTLITDNVEPSETSLTLPTDNVEPSETSWTLPTDNVGPSETSWTLPTDNVEPSETSWTLPTDNVEPSETSWTLPTDNVEPSETSWTLPTDNVEPSETSWTLPTDNVEPSETSWTLPTGVETITTYTECSNLINIDEGVGSYVECRADIDDQDEKNEDETVHIDDVFGTDYEAEETEVSTDVDQGQSGVVENVISEINQDVQEEEVLRLNLQCLDIDLTDKRNTEAYVNGASNEVQLFEDASGVMHLNDEESRTEDRLVEKEVSIDVINQVDIGVAENITIGVMTDDEVGETNTDPGILDNDSTEKTSDELEYRGTSESCDVLYTENEIINRGLDSPKDSTDETRDELEPTKSTSISLDDVLPSENGEILKKGLNLSGKHFVSESTRNTLDFYDELEPTQNTSESYDEIESIQNTSESYYESESTRNSLESYYESESTRNTSESCYEVESIHNSSDSYVEVEPTRNTSGSYNELEPTRNSSYFYVDAEPTRNSSDSYDEVEHTRNTLDPYDEVESTSNISDSHDEVLSTENESIKNSDLDISENHFSNETNDEVFSTESTEVFSIQSTEVFSTESTSNYPEEELSTDNESIMNTVIDLSKNDSSDDSSGETNDGIESTQSREHSTQGIYGSHDGSSSTENEEMNEDQDLSNNNYTDEMSSEAESVQNTSEYSTENEDDTTNTDEGETQIEDNGNTISQVNELPNITNVLSNERNSCCSTVNVEEFGSSTDFSAEGNVDTFASSIYNYYHDADVIAEVTIPYEGVQRRVYSSIDMLEDTNSNIVPTGSTSQAVDGREMGEENSANNITFAVEEFKQQFIRDIEYDRSINQPTAEEYVEDTEDEEEYMEQTREVETF